MDSAVTRQLEMLVRVRDFGAAHADLFPAHSTGRKMFAATAAAIAALGQHAAAQVSGRSASREASSSKAAARTALRDALGALSRTARALALDTPRLRDKFRLPRAQGDRALLSAGRAFAQDARPLASAFIALDLPPTFLKDLDAAIQGFEAAIDDRSAGSRTAVAARAAIAAALDEGLTAVQRLDAIVMNRLRDDPATRAEWERARHVGRQRAKNGAPSSVPPGPPVMPPATAASAPPASVSPAPHALPLAGATATT